MKIQKTHLEWLKKHAEQRKDSTWYCKKTGRPITQYLIGRTIWIEGLLGGVAGGEVSQVVHLVCTGCDKDPKFPKHGSPIGEDELVEVAT